MSIHLSDIDEAKEVLASYTAEGIRQFWEAGAFRECDQVVREYLIVRINSGELGDPTYDRITVAWLMQMHPELSKEEAEAYRVFCKSHTIVYRNCYGQGEIMWPLWLKHRENELGCDGG